MSDPARKRWRTSAEVLDAVFALPSDSESEDGADQSDSEFEAHDYDINYTESSDSDDEILYQLADSCSSSDSSESDETDDSVSAETDWDKADISPPEIDFDAVNVLPTISFSESDGPLDFFSLFFDDPIFEYMVKETNRYAKQSKIRHWKETSVPEIKAFFGIMIAMGLHKLPDVELAWSSEPLFRVQPLAEIMPVKRYKKLRQAFHLNNNRKAPKRGSPNFDKLFKIRPLVDHLNYKFQHSAVSASSQSIDEAMVKFKGRNTMKQYMPMKPTKRGFKVWARTDSKSGYLYEFSIYTGKSDGTDGVGLGSKVVEQLTESIRGKQHHVTFDNFFASVNLVENLFKDGILSTCTVRTNRKQLPVLSEHNPTNRGDWNWRTRGDVGYVQWRDTKTVHVLSTAFRPYIIGQVNRKQRTGESVAVKCPLPILQYTARMGGVDRFDQQRGWYSVSRRSRKWWMRLFFFLIDAALVNSYILYSSVAAGNAVSTLQFRSTLFRQLVAGFSARKRKSSLEGSSWIRRRRDHKSGRKRGHGVPDDVRLDSVGKHWPKYIPNFRRCRFCSSKQNNKRTRLSCAQCDVPLCIVPCFEEFHTRS